jgi:hypothetical protein
MIGWVNGNEYQQSAETFGILPLMKDIHIKLRMSPYHHIYVVLSQLKLTFWLKKLSKIGKISRIFDNLNGIKSQGVFCQS